MNVLVDTSVWSLALRRTDSTHSSRSELERLVLDGRVAIIGPIRQEILSGVRIATQFNHLRNQLKAFPDTVLTTEDFEEAARFYNRCRERGIQGSNTDFLICAAAVRLQMPILTTDGDFKHFAKILPITLH